MNNEKKKSSAFELIAISFSIALFAACVLLAYHFKPATEGVLADIFASVTIGAFMWALVVIGISPFFGNGKERK